MNYFDIMLIVIELLACLLLWLLAGYAERVISSKWRLCYLAPALLCLLLVFCAGFEPLMIGAYIGSAALAAGFFKDVKKARRTASVVSAALIAAALPFCLLGEGYRNRIDYVADFEKGYRSMKAHYALTKYKDIDWDMLYDKYLPRFKEAKKNRDKNANYIAWCCFCAEFYDGHVGFSADEETMKSAEKQAAGNDYGLVIMTLADGKTVAVNVDESLSELGIHNGTEIISWDGMTPAEADKRSQTYEMTQLSDEDNMKFFEGMFAAGVGGDNVTVVYTDDSGSEQTVQLDKLSDAYIYRLQGAIDAVFSGVQAGNLQWTRLNDTTACLRIKQMMYDSQSSKSEEHRLLKGELSTTVRKFMEDGVTDVVIDIRSNSGGSGDMVKAIASLFATEGEHYYVSNALWDDKLGKFATDENGDYIVDNDVTFTGDNILGDGGRVILLVDAFSASASDHITKVMSSFDNVTVIGFTQPNGSAQGVYQIDLASGSLSYSSSVMLNRDGSIFIDSGTDHQTGDDVDIKVVFDEQAMHAVFDDGKDYILDYALSLLAE